jgi:glyoxylase-like metal-dependent hydrolase (beta-lactamase superfamily II)
MPIEARLDSVITVDSHYTAPEKMAVFLVLEGNRAAFVDNNTVHAVPRLLDALHDAGHAPEDVDYLIVTHVHLDHAGGTAALLAACPNATVLAHPRAARHLIDPARLIAGATQVYGEEAFNHLYGEIQPIPEGRVRVMADGEELAWGSRTLRFIHTLGHASHHMVIHDTGADGVFVGDALGIGRGPHLRPGPAFIIAATAPPEFDAHAAKEAVQRIQATGATRAFLAHYGVFENLDDTAQKLLHNLNQHACLIEDALAQDLPEEALNPFFVNGLQQAFEEHLRWCGVENVAADLHTIAGDVGLNAMGLAARVRRLRRG